MKASDNLLILSFVLFLTGFFTILNGQTNEWNGSVNTSWNEPGNWSLNHVPTQNEEVTIPNVANSPIIPSGTTVTIKKLEVSFEMLKIEAGATLNIDNQSSGQNAIELRGQLENFGEINIENASTGIILFSGLDYEIVNQNTGIINIEDCTEKGILLYDRMTNYGELHINNVGTEGIFINRSFGEMRNRNGGMLTINNTGSDGIKMGNPQGSSHQLLSNSGSLLIGNLPGSTINGVGIINRWTCILSGITDIKHTTGHGITNDNQFSGTGTININDTGKSGFVNVGLGTTSFNGNLHIGNTGTIGENGIFNNGASLVLRGTVTIDNCTLNGMKIGGNGDLFNEATINIGDLGNIGENGIQTASKFSNFPTENNSSGTITINNVGKNGILSTGLGGFVNYGDVEIGQIGSVGEHGISNTKTFKNQGGSIIIFSSTLDGLNISTSGTFTNNALLNIGNGLQNPFGQNGLLNEGNFENKNCKKIVVSDKIDNSGTFTNNGLISSLFLGNHNNSGTFTNSGIIEDIHDAFNGASIVNNEIIVSPLVECTTNAMEFQPALQLGGGASHTVGITWYSDPAMSIVAGTYDQTLNKFTTTLSQGTHMLYFDISKAGGCNKNVMLNMTITANAPPIALCKNLEITLNANLSASITPDQVDNGSHDACSGVTLEISQSDFDCTHVGMPQNVMLTVTDNNNNSSTCNAEITVFENANVPCCVAPNAVCQSHEAILDGTGNVTISVSDVDGGSMADCGIQSLEIDKEDFDCSHVGIPQMVILTITDQNNDSDNCNATVTVKDEMKPDFNGTCANYPNPFSTDVGNCYATINFNLPNPTDNCGVTELKAKILDSNGNTFQNWTDDPNGQFPPDNYQIKWRAKDATGNKKFCTKNFIVKDDEDPIAQCVTTHTVQLTNGGGTISTNDLDSGSSDNCSFNLSLSQMTFDCNDRGSSTVTLTATDDAGNSDHCTTDIEVLGTTLTIEDLSQNEGTGAGYTFFFFKVERGGGGCTDQVDYSTSDGTATLGDNDYVNQSGTHYWPPTGSNIRYTIVRGVKDANYESDEYFWVDLSNASIGVTITKAQGKAELLNDDAVPFFVFPNQEKENPNYVQLQIQQNKVAMYPNPVQNEFQLIVPEIWLEEGVIEVGLFNNLGEQISGFNLTENQSIIEVAALPTGTYQLSFRTKSGFVQTERFVKVD